MRVLVVDESVDYRAAIKAALAAEPLLTLAGVAATGRIALAKLRDGMADVVVLSLGLPEGEALATLEAIRSERLGVSVVLLAPGVDGAKAAQREAQRLGVSDVVAKGADGESAAALSARLRSDLMPALRSLATRTPGTVTATPPARTAPRAVEPADRPERDVRPDLGNRQDRISSLFTRAIVIASSTGGPSALERLFSHLVAPISVPVLLVQHMPPDFTRELAATLAGICGVPAAEGIDGEPVVPGRIYVAPGDRHMVVARREGQAFIEINQGPPVHFVRPAADPLFKSAAAHWGDGLMGFVLTGMGGDGAPGAAEVRARGGAVMIQDKATAVVWGMPGAVHELGAFDRMGSLDECGQLFAALATRQRLREVS
jgi:two-component system chemotaxis response regulator CheB